MKINAIRWTNYKGLADGEIVANGGDVTVSGRNGSGKSSIASIIPFVLFGKVTGSLRRYENGIVTPSGLIHGAEIEFDDGTILRRELHDAKQSSGTTTKLFVDGEPEKKPMFDARIAQMTCGLGELILNPFAFCDLPVKDRRDLLFKHFSTVSEKNFLAQHADIAELLKGRSVTAFTTACKSELKKLQSDAKSIPPRIEEITRQLKDEPLNDANLTAEIDSIHNELAKLQQSTQHDTQTELYIIRHDLDNFEGHKRVHERNLQQCKITREKLLERYRKVKATKPGTCPTCGQKIPAETFARKRDAELAEIVQSGKEIAAQITLLERELNKTDGQIEKFRAREAELTALIADEEKSSEVITARVRELNHRLGQLTELQTMVKLAAKQRARIDELKREEKKINARITELEGQIARAEKFQLDFMLATEQQINANFKSVKFKLFDYLATSGDVRPTCEATLNGVPYTALSKGEKLRAALDILAALQAKFGLELPLILDDAESYSEATLSELPENQLILLKVTDGDLETAISQKRVAA